MALQYLTKKEISFEVFLECANTYFPEKIQKGVRNSIKNYIDNAEKHRKLGLFHHKRLLNTMKLLFDQDTEMELLFDEYEDKKKGYYTVTKIVDFLESRGKVNLLHLKEFRDETADQQGMKVDILGSEDQLLKERSETIGIKIDQPIGGKNLMYIEKVWKLIYSMFLTPVESILVYIYEACIEVTWEVSSHDMMNFSLKKLNDRRKILQEKNIITVWRNGEVLYHEDIHVEKNKMKVSV